MDLPVSILTPPAPRHSSRALGGTHSIMKFLSIFAVLRILRSRLLARLFGYRVELLLRYRLKENYEAYVPLLVGELCTSRSCRYSDLMLSVIDSLPDEIRESNGSLRRYFITDDLRASSVAEGVGVCRNALLRCFHSTRK
jgi:hypothetical protein